MKKISAFTVILFSLSSLFSLSQNDCVYDLAERLYTNDAKKESALEYKRYLFLENEAPSEKTLNSCRKLSSWYEEINDYERAIYFNRHAINISTELKKSRSEIDELYIYDIRLISTDRKAVNTETSLFTYTYDEYSEKVRNTAWKALIKTNIENRNYDIAQRLFELEESQKVKSLSQTDSTALAEAFNKLHNTSFKNPKLALGLSIIPGLGQCYAHRFKDGINAFVLDGGLIALCAASIATGNYSDFFFFEFSPAFRFYRGNLYNAQRDTYDYNDEACDEIFKEVLKILAN